MSNQKREQQMFDEAKAYAEEIYKDYPNGLNTKHKIAETIADFCAGWRAADNGKWIPVEKELPKEGQVVLIHTKGNSVSTACYTDGRFDITELLEAINVTHWMEIVPPRKEE